tara:strand:- start:203 stop:1213 length:1011 start_codon:yes stop_codon:yes gene_type:complete
MDNLETNDIWDLFDIAIDKSCEKIDNTKCSECNSNELINNNDSLICKNCGIVSNNIFDRSIEFSKDNNSRVGCATNHFLPQSSLGTKIGGRYYSRMTVIQNKWSRMVYKERSLLNVLKQIEHKCSEYNITKPIIDNAKILFKKINDSKHKYGKNKNKQIIIRGLNRTGLIAACIYHGAEMHGKPRSQKEIAEICNINITYVTKGCRKFREILAEDSILLLFKSSNALDFIKRYCDVIKMNNTHKESCIELCNNIKLLEIASDHQPPSIAAGCLILISNKYKLNINIKDISNLFKISEVTIKKTHKKIFGYEKILFDKELLNKAFKLLNINEVKYIK